MLNQLLNLIQVWCLFIEFIPFLLNVTSQSNTHELIVYDPVVEQLTDVGIMSNLLSNSNDAKTEMIVPDYLFEENVISYLLTNDHNTSKMYEANQIPHEPLYIILLYVFFIVSFIALPFMIIDLQYSNSQNNLNPTHSISDVVSLDSIQIFRNESTIVYYNRQNVMRLMDDNSLPSSTYC